MSLSLILPRRALKLPRRHRWLAVAIIGLCLLSACERNLYEPTDKAEVAAKGLSAAVLSHDGNFAVVGAVFEGVSYWQLQPRERLYNWTHQQQENTVLSAADLSSDGRWAATAYAHNLVLWDTASGKALRYWSAPGEILAIALSARAQFAVLGLSNNTAVLFDIRRGGILRTFHHEGRVRSVALSRDDRIAVTGSEDYTAVTWELASGKQLATMQHQDEVQLVRVAQDGSVVLSMSKYDKAALWQSDTGEPLGEIPLAAERIKRGLRFTAARLSADAENLLVGRPDGRVTLWHLKSLNKIASWKMPKRNPWQPSGAAVLDVAFLAQPNSFRALLSNGYAVTLTLPENP